MVLKNTLLGTSLFMLWLANASAKNSKDLKADRNFLKAMNVKAPGLEKVDALRRKQFWKETLSGARLVDRKLDEEDNGDDGEDVDDGDGGGDDADDGDQDNQQAYYGWNENSNYANAYDPNGFTDVSWDNLGFPIQDYSLKYTGCSAVQSWDDEEAEENESSVFRTNRFATFRLCPSEKCNSNSNAGCGSSYGEYVLDMEEFLYGVVKFNRQRYWHYCNYCKRCNALESFGAAMSKVEEEKQEYLKEQQEYRNSLQEQQAQYDANQQQFYQDEEANFDDDGNNRKLSNNNNNFWYQQNGDYEDAQKYGQSAEKNQASYWYDKITAQWDEDWDENWMMFNWQYLPYCSESDLDSCKDANDMCQGFEDEGYSVDQEENSRFASCTAIDNGYYVAPHCANDGITISLGVYSDDYCNQYVKDISIDEVLGYSIEGDFEFFPTGECLSCAEGEEEKIYNQFIDANNDYDDFETYMEAQFEEYVQMEEQQQNYQGNTQWRNYEQQSYQNGDQNANGNEQANDDQYKYWYQYNRNGGGGGYGGNQQTDTTTYSNMYNGNNGFYYNRTQLYGDGSDGKSVGFYAYQNNKYGANNNDDEDNEENEGSNWGQYGISDVCGVLYEYSAKCNKRLKNSDGQEFSNSYMSEQQLQDEQLVCNYIGNLQRHAYNEYGEIVLNGYNTFNTVKEVDWTDVSSVNYARKSINVTPWQTASIALLILGSIGMVIMICVLHFDILKRGIALKMNEKSEEHPIIKREDSGIVLGRSQSGDGLGGKTTPLI